MWSTRNMGHPESQVSENETWETMNAVCANSEQWAAPQVLFLFFFDGALGVG
jgi:hypothetical protein